MKEAGLGAVVDHRGAAIRVEPIVADDPGPGEVLVRLARAACVTAMWAIEHGNQAPAGRCCSATKGPASAEAVGDGVTSVAAGDRVVITWAVPCVRWTVPARCATPMRT